MKPFAFEVYRKFLNGQTAEQLSTGLGIPVDRIEQRLRAAAQYRKLRRDGAGQSMGRQTEELLLRLVKKQ